MLSLVANLEMSMLGFCLGWSHVGWVNDILTAGASKMEVRDLVDNRTVYRVDSFVFDRNASGSYVESALRAVANLEKRTKNWPRFKRGRHFGAAKNSRAFRSMPALERCEFVCSPCFVSFGRDKCAKLFNAKHARRGRDVARRRFNC